MKQSLIAIAALLLVLLGTAMLSLRKTTPIPVKHYALLIEVSQYETEALEDLKYPRKETEALAQELQAQYGFKVDVLNSPTGKTILDKFDEVYENYGNGTLDSTGQLIIYLSGHGEFDEKSKSGFFLPADYNPEVLDLTALSYDLWRKKINALPCKHIFVILDACYSGTFDNSIAMRGTSKKFKPQRPGSLSNVDKILNEHDKLKTRLFVSSGLKEQTPDKSQLSYQLLEGLRKGIKDQGMITLDELYANHLKHAKPTPLYGPFGDNAANSHFLFIEGGMIDVRVDRAEEELWQWASKYHKRNGYKFYLDEYPTGRYAQEARNHVAEYIIDLDAKSPKTIYVNHNNTEDGSGESWNESIKNLRYALAIAEPGDKIWVAAGTYLPSYTGDRNKSFELRPGVELYGGFRGDEIVLSERDCNKNKVILSGNIGDKYSTDDNTYNVVYTKNIGEFVIVDGVTISEGNARNFTKDVGRGSSAGGWLNFADNDNSSPKIANVQFTDNRGHNGGGMSNISLNGGTSSPQYMNTTWENNRADFKGGALYNFSIGSTSSPIIRDSKFINNSANEGAAIVNNAAEDGDASPLLLSCGFDKNTSLKSGAAIFNIIDETGRTDVVLESCSFMGNASILVGQDSTKRSNGGSLRPRSRKNE